MAHILTTLEVLGKGLGYDQRQIGRAGMKNNISRFRTNYVSHPRVCADLFERLQRIGGLDCAVLGIDKTENCFFAAACLLAQYPTEEKAESAFSFNMCDRTFRDHAWDIVWKIFDLHHHIIAWPTWWGNPDDPNGPITKFSSSSSTLEALVLAFFLELLVGEQCEMIGTGHVES